MASDKNNSIVDLSLFHITEDAVDDAINLKLRFVRYFQDNTPCIGILPVIDDLIPSGGGKVW